MWIRLSKMLIAAAAVCIGGCGQQDVVTQDIGNQGHWRIRGDFHDMAKAVDGDIQTAAFSGNSPTTGIYIDLGKPREFNTIILDHGPGHEFNFPNRLSVFTSLDGRNWSTVYVVQGTRRVTYIPLMTRTVVRYIRLQTAAKNDRPWTIAEIYLQ